jgi:hypothetical protein
MQEPDLLAFFVLTQLQGTVCHLFNHLVKWNVAFFVIELNMLFLGFHAHLLDFVSNRALVQRLIILQFRGTVFFKA